jgi:hypothetical protein
MRRDARFFRYCWCDLFRAGFLGRDFAGNERLSRDAARISSGHNQIEQGRSGMSSPSDSNNLQRQPEFPRIVHQPQATARVDQLHGVLSDIGRNNITARAQQIRYSTDEDMVWQATPSMLLLIPRAVKYAVILALIVIGCAYLNRWEDQLAAQRANRFVRTFQPQGAPLRKAGRLTHSAKARAEAAPDAAAATANPPASVPQASTPQVSSQQTDPVSERFHRFLLEIQLGFLALFVLLLGLYALRLRTTRYSASSQRLIIEDGILHSVNRPYEMHILSNAVISRPLLLRMFGMGNIVIASPRLVLLGIRNADLVRDLLRTAGQLEAQRMDKIRWR